MATGAVVSSKLAWSVAIFITAAMAVPNLVMIFMLRNDIAKETKKYLKSEIDGI